MAAPPSQVVALRLDHAVGKVLSGDLAILLLHLANACSNVADDENFVQIQEYLTKFLFDEGKQVLRVLLSNQGNDIEIQHAVNSMVNVFPLTNKFGDADILFQFKPNTTKDGADGNELRVGVGLVGVPPFEVIAHKIRNLIGVATDEGKAIKYASDMAASFVEAMLQVFPNGHQFLTDVFDMDSFSSSFVPRGEGILVDIEAEVNIDKLEKLYPAVANWLKHVQRLEFFALDMPQSGMEPDFEIEKAPCFFRLVLEYNGGLVNVKCNFMLSASSNSLLWFDQLTEGVVMNDLNKPRKVELDESATGQAPKFRLVIDDTIRLHELGCGSFKLPLIVLQLTIHSSKTKFPHMYERDVETSGPSPAHRLELRMLHVGQKRLTSILVRPFINLGAFREMLLRDFHFEIDFIPSTKEKRDFFAQEHDDDSIKVIPGQWSMVARFKMVIAPVSGVVISFLKMFTNTQLANPDDLKFWWQIALALHRDLKLMHGRLSRAEGSKPEFELTSDAQTTFRPKSQRTRPVKTRRSRCTIM